MLCDWLHSKCGLFRDALIELAPLIANLGRANLEIFYRVRSWLALQVRDAGLDARRQAQGIVIIKNQSDRIEGKA